VYKDRFREAHAKLEDIPKSLRFENENELLKSRLSLMEEEKLKDEDNSSDLEDKTSKEEESKSSTKSSKEESKNTRQDDVYLDLEQDQDNMPYFDTIDLVKRFGNLDSEKCLLHPDLVLRILKTSKYIPSEVRGSEFADDYEMYGSLGEFPYFSLGHGLITRGVRSRKFRYLYLNRRMLYTRFSLCLVVFVVVPLIVILPLCLLMDISLAYQDVLLTFSISSPVLFLSRLIYSTLRDATPNPLKRAYGPIVSWYVCVCVCVCGLFSRWFCFSGF